LTGGISVVTPALAQDTNLSEILIDGEDWELAADKLKFTEGPAAGPHGNLYFSDLAGSKIYRLDAAGQPEVFVANSSNANGLSFGPDGRLFACEVGKRRIAAFDTTGKESSVFAGDFAPNDLVVLRDGSIYFTDPDGKSISHVPPKGIGRVVDRGIGRPNGIALWPGQSTLVVSDTTGIHAWVFRIESDGSLSDKSPFYTLETPAGHAASGADGMTFDSQGRLFVASYLGIQVFDTQGRLAGIIAKPSTAFISNVKFAGPKFDTLFVTSTDKIYRRKTKVTGIPGYDQSGK